MMDKMKKSLKFWAKYMLHEIIVYLGIVIFVATGFIMVAGLLTLANHLR